MTVQSDFKRLAIICLLFITVSVMSCNNSDTKLEQSSDIKRKAEPTNKSVTISTFQVSGGWGYDIAVNDTLYIHQNHVPAINGMYVFASEAEALRVANLIAEKMNNNIIPPTINQDEMQALGVTFQPVEQ